jgi:hypothetical protein
MRNFGIVLKMKNAEKMREMVNNEEKWGNNAE